MQADAGIGPDGAGQQFAAFGATGERCGMGGSVPLGGRDALRDRGAALAEP